MTESSAPRSSTLRQRILLITGVGALAVVLTGFYFREDLIEGSFGTGQVAPTDVKNHGVVVGWAQKGPGRCVFRWTKEDGFEGLTHYDYPGYATAINDDGWIVGCYETSTVSPFLSSPDRDVQLIHTAIEYKDVSGRDINSRGEALLAGILRPKKFADPRTPVALNYHGWILFAGSHDTEPGPSFVLRDGEFRELPVPEGASHAKYEALNNEGWVLGRAKIGDEWRGFVLRPYR